jgi:hypothetical protein
MEHCCRLLISKENKNPIWAHVFSSFTKYETTKLLIDVGYLVHATVWSLLLYSLHRLSFYNLFDSTVLNSYVLNTSVYIFLWFFVHLFSHYTYTLFLCFFFFPPFCNSLFQTYPKRGKSSSPCCRPFLASKEHEHGEKRRAILTYKEHL